MGSAYLLIMALATTVLTGVPGTAAAAERPGGAQAHGSAQREPTVAGRRAVPTPVAPLTTAPDWRATPPVWPAQATAEVTVPAARPAGTAAAGPAAPVRAGDLPVWIEGMPDGRESLRRVRVRQVGRDRVVLRMDRTDGTRAGAPARVTIDAGRFRTAYGGDWASRLRLWSLTEDCLTGRPSDCRATPLPSRIDAAKATVSARVEVPGAVTGTAPSGALVALAADASGAAGDFAATSLSPSATWNAGGNSGGFSWSYPLRTPPALNGPAPEITLNYSSAGVDGRMAAGNNQPSWLGEGFDWHPGFVERRYVPCADDMGGGATNTERRGDLCWRTDNAVLTMPGHAGELIRDGSGADRWRLRVDDGTRIERRTGAANGDDNGEWWLVTTTDGTTYWYGGRAGSQATLTVPVFGNHSGEPCARGTFAASNCQQGYRWQLDHVVDRHGNTMRIGYAKETNRYARNAVLTDAAPYDRAGHPEVIEYGTRTDSADPAPMRVTFATADRCLVDCGNPANWPDLPKDRECAASPCGFAQVAPTFWTKKRLSAVTTWIRDGAGYDEVESWTFTHAFPDPTDSVGPVLWLARISHTGEAGDGTVALPDVEFAGTALTNRVDTNNDQYPAMRRFRIKTVRSETGGVTDVTYSPADCVAGTRVPDRNNLHLNALRCYPVRWRPEGNTAPIDDFFHKYVVTEVGQAELTGGSPRTRVRYAYQDAPAWHFTDEDGLVKAEFKTWSVWRGYGEVVTTTGDAGEQTVTRTRFFRGMHGDKLPTGTRQVTLPAVAVGDVPAVADEDEFAGMVREAVTYDGEAEVSANVTVPWRSAPTASRTLDGVTVHARMVGPGAQHTRTALDGGRGHRTTRVTTGYDEYGMPDRVDDQGDEARDDDQRCVLTTYRRNTEAWIVDRVARQRTFAVDCARQQAGGLTDAQVVGDVRTSYDGAGWDAVPTRGLVSRVETLKTYHDDDSRKAYVTEQQFTHDAYGRVTASTDVRGATTTTTYTPVGGGPVTGVTATNALGWTTATTLAPAWGQPVRLVDANDRVTELAYDPLGRLTSVWLPGRDRVSWPRDASIEYDYQVRNDNLGSTVTTRRLKPGGGYLTSHTIHDNLSRVRQTQAPDGAGGAGAVITDTFYDTAGRVSRVLDPYVPADHTLSGVLFTVPGTVPSARTTRYDGAGRTAAETHLRDVPAHSPGGTVVAQTRYGYGGDRVDTTPPVGGAVTSTLRDAAGRVVELRQYRAGQPAGGGGGFDRTTYHHDAKGQLVRVTDAVGATWSYGYDLRGRTVKTVDPDLGTVISSHADSGDLVTQTDAEGQTIAHTYDLLGRKTSTRDDSVTGPKRAEWVWDEVAGTTVRGQLGRSTRYVGTEAYTREIRGYTVGYQPTAVRYTVPAGVTGQTSYEYVHGYHPEDGSPRTVRLPAAGGLPMETLTHEYDGLGRPSALKTSLGGTYVTGTDYTSFSELGALHLRHNDGDLVDITRTYATDTRRLAQIWTTRQRPTAGVATDVSDLRYGYDPAGNVTSITDDTSDDRQCFAVDHAQRLTDAWTPADGNCAAGPAVALGGPAAYRHAYGYDPAGSRTTMTAYGTPAGDRTTTYTIAAGGHRVTGTSTADSAGIRTAAFGYDGSGNVNTRPAPAGGAQSLVWDRERRLASTDDAAGPTSYVYDADGNRLVRRDPAGRTLYLPGQEIRVTGGGATATRYYTHAGQPVATRSPNGVTWLAGDHHGTTQAAVTAVGQTVAIRRQTPFGEQRGAAVAWPANLDKGFVGGTKDPTGLTHLGAREYDPALGRFLSVDPVINITDPQQINGYNYGNNNPVTLSDPDGLVPRSCPDGECSSGIGPPKRANNPATSYNPPVRKGAGGRGHQTVNRNRANCPDGVSSCAAARGSTSRATNLCQVTDCADRRSGQKIVYNWLGDNATPEFLDHVKRSATEAGIDPQLLLAVLIAESGDCHCAEKDDDSIRVASVGLANLQMDAFVRAVAHSGGAIDFGRRDTHNLKDLGNIQRSVTAAAYYLKFLGDRVDNTHPAPSNPTISRNEIIRIGYNMGIGSQTGGERDWMTAVAGLDRFPAGDPGRIILDFRERWYVAGNLLSASG
ncbi:RHS repeat-associated core domain-containing protein [Micromonospora citrea]|nr:RHS repeat-associated core domain-containing protein [Micromonospora citrea]